MLQAIYKKILVGSIALASVFTATALNLPVKHINGKAFYYYTVDKKDRPYSLAEKIGVKRSDIVKYNPHAADGLQAGMLLTFPVDMDASVIDGYYTISYVPGKDETIYGLSKYFDIPVDRIIEFNPQAANGIHNMTLILPLQRTDANDTKDSDAGLSTEMEQPSAVSIADDSPEKGRPYIIGKGETLTKIARDNNISVNDILQLNPGLNPHKYQAGQRIFLPQSAALTPVENRPAPQPFIPETVPTTTTHEPAIIPLPATVDDVTEPTYETAYIVDEPEKPVSIAVLLPFMLNETEESKTTKLFTEFYRGFLLATEDLSHDGSPVKIYAYDTASSPDTVRSILDATRPDSIDIFVGADDEAILSILANDAADRNAYVLNIFAVKDESYKDIPSMIQANIPHDYMYAKAIDGFIEKYQGMTPVFISRVDGQADKIEFTTELRTALDSKGIRYIDLPFRNSLSDELMADLSVDSSYVFVPVTGNHIEFNKFAPALKSFRETMVNPSGFALFGYPEWVMFRNERLDYLHALNTTIYSRFFASTESPLAAKLADDYKTRFGLEMLEAVPSQGLLGYDTAVFLIRSLRNNEGNFSESSMAYDGVQSGFDISRPEGIKGLVNTNLYFVTFGPNRATTKVQI